MLPAKETNPADTVEDALLFRESRGGIGIFRASVETLGGWASPGREIPECNPVKLKDEGCSVGLDGSYRDGRP